MGWELKMIQVQIVGEEEEGQRLGQAVGEGERQRQRYEQVVVEGGEIDND